MRFIWSGSCDVTIEIIEKVQLRRWKHPIVDGHCRRGMILEFVSGQIEPLIQRSHTNVSGTKMAGNDAARHCA